MSFSSKITTMINIIKGARNALITKGETVTHDNDIPQIIEDMDTGGEETNFIAFLYDGKNLNVPSGTTRIGVKIFYQNTAIEKLKIPSSVAYLGAQCFMKCTNLEEIEIDDGLETLLDSTFCECSAINRITLPSTLKTISYRCFADTTFSSISLPTGITTIAGQAFFRAMLTTINLPASIVNIGNTAFQYCLNLEFVTIESGFNCNGLDLSVSTKYSAATIVSWLNALADRTGDTAYTLTIGSTNLAKLSAAEIAIATNKNWNLA